MLVPATHSLAQLHVFQHVVTYIQITYCVCSSGVQVCARVFMLVLTLDLCVYHFFSLIHEPILPIYPHEPIHFTGIIAECLSWIYGNTDFSNVFGKIVMLVRLTRILRLLVMIKRFNLIFSTFMELVPAFSTLFGTSA